MAAFNLTAQLNITGPNNLKPVISNLRKQLGTVNGNVNIQINPNVASAASGLNGSLKSLDATLKNINSSASSASAAFRQLGAAIRSVDVKSVPRDMAAITQQSQRLQAQQAKTAATITDSSNSMVEFGKQSALAIRRFAAFSLVTGVIFKFTNALGQASSEFMKFNKQLVQLSQVTGTSLQGLSGLEQTITSLSTSLGVSSSSLIDVSSTLAQAGLSANETEEALKALAKSVLAPSFGNLNETVEGSIALMRQFSISTAQLEAALGSINSVAAKFAVEADDIIVAIQRTGGVFAAASKGVVDSSEALNQFIALFTSVRATTRESAETIATGLRTIFTRIQRKDTIELLKQYGIQLTDLEGKFVGPYEAVKRLSRGLAGLDTRDIRFSSIIEELGGFRQVGKVIPLLQQFSTAERALMTAQRGQGSLTADAAKAQQALAIQMAKVQEEFIALVRSIGSSNQFQTMVKVALDLASALISVADASKHAMPAIAGLLAVKGTIGAVRFASGFASGMRRGGGGGSGGTRMSGAPRGFAGGGQVPVALEPGEMVFVGKTAQKAGYGNLRRLNRAGDRPNPMASLNRSGGGGVFMVPGSGRGDTFRTSLPEGSFVIKRRSVRAIGADNIAQIAVNGGTINAVRQSFSRGSSTGLKQKVLSYNSKEDTVRAHAIGKSYSGRQLKQQYQKSASSLGIKISKNLSKILDGDNLTLKPNFTIGLPQSFNEALKTGGKGIIPLEEFIKALDSPYLMAGGQRKGKEVKYSSRLARQSIRGIPKDIVEQIRTAFKQEATSRAQIIDGQPYITSDRDIDNFGQIAKSIMKKHGLWKPRPAELMSRTKGSTGSSQSREFIPTPILDDLDQQGIFARFALGGTVKRLSGGSDKPLANMRRADLINEAKKLGVSYGSITSWQDLGNRGDIGAQARAKLIAKLEEARILRKTAQAETSAKAKRTNVAVIGAMAPAGVRGSSSEVIIPGAKDRKTGRRIKDTPATLHIGALEGKTAARVTAIIRNQTAKITEQVMKVIAQEAGIALPRDARSRLKKRPMHSGIAGGLLEQAVLSLMGIDKPMGSIDLGASGLSRELANVFGIPDAAGVPTDITYGGEGGRTLAQAAKRKAVGRSRDSKGQRKSSQIGRGIAALRGAQGKALGGLIQRFASGGKLSRSTYKLVPQEKGIGPAPTVSARSTSSSDFYGLLNDSGLPKWEHNQILDFLRTNKYSASEAKQYIEKRKRERNSKLAARTDLTQLTESLNVQASQTSARQRELAQSLLHRYNGGEIPFQPEQFFARGSKGPLVRKMGILDSDQLRNSERARKAMRELGFHNPDKDTYDVDGYKKLLSQTAISKRSEGALKKLVTIAGSPGAGKSSFAEGNARTAISDNARLRKTERSFIETPEDFTGLSEVRDTTASMTLEKLEMAKKSDRVVALSSSTKEELQILKQQLKHRTATGEKQYGRTHTIAAQDSGELEAMLSMGIDHKKLITLGLMPGFKKRRKGANELPYVTTEDVDMFRGAYAPMTAKGHIEGLIDNAKQKKLIIVGSNEGYNPKDPHSLRTAGYDQKLRMKIAGASVPDAYVSGAGKGFTLPEIYEVQKENGRRHFVRPGKGSRAFVGDEGKDLGAYEKAGLKTVTVPRPEGSESGTATRARIASGDFSGLHPNAESILRGAATSVRNRENITPRLYEKAEKRALAKIAAIDKQLSQYPSRLSSAYKKENPDVAATVEKLRSEKTKIKSAISMSHHKTLARLAKRYPSIYGYSSTDSSKTMQGMIESGMIRPSQPTAIAGRFAAGGSVAKMQKQFGKIGLRSSGKQITAFYFKNNVREGFVTANEIEKGIWNIGLSKATKGYGPRLYDAVMEAVTARGGVLTAHRGKVSGHAKKVWDTYANERSKPDSKYGPQVTKIPLDAKHHTISKDPTDSLNQGYQQQPNIIKGSDVVDMNDSKYDKFLQQMQFEFLRAGGGNISRSARGNSRIIRKPSSSAVSSPKPQSGYDQIRSIENQIAQLNNRRTILISHTKTSLFGNKSNPYQREIFDLEDEIARLSQVKYRLSQESRSSNIVSSTKTPIRAVTPTKKMVTTTAAKPTIASIKQPIIQSKTNPKPGSIYVVLNRQQKAELSQTIKRLNAEIKEADERISGFRSHDIKPGFFGKLIGQSTKNPYQQELWDEEARKSRAETEKRRLFEQYGDQLREFDRFASGGEIPIMAKAGEFVINKHAAGQIGHSTLRKLNRGGKVAIETLGKLPKYHSGGSVQKLKVGGKVGTTHNDLVSPADLEQRTPTGGDTIARINKFNQKRDVALKQIETSKAQETEDLKAAAGDAKKEASITKKAKAHRAGIRQGLADEKSRAQSDPQYLTHQAQTTTTPDGAPVTVKRTAAQIRADREAKGLKIHKSLEDTTLETSTPGNQRDSSVAGRTESRGKERAATRAAKRDALQARFRDNPDELTSEERSKAIQQQRQTSRKKADPIEKQREAAKAAGFSTKVGTSGSTKVTDEDLDTFKLSRKYQKQKARTANANIETLPESQSGFMEEDARRNAKNQARQNRRPQTATNALIGFGKGGWAGITSGAAIGAGVAGLPGALLGSSIGGVVGGVGGAMVGAIDPKANKVRAAQYRKTASNLRQTAASMAEGGSSGSAVVASLGKAFSPVVSGAAKVASGMAKLHSGAAALSSGLSKVGGGVNSFSRTLMTDPTKALKQAFGLAASSIVKLAKGADSAFGSLMGMKKTDIGGGKQGWRNAPGGIMGRVGSFFGMGGGGEMGEDGVTRGPDGKRKKGFGKGGRRGGGGGMGGMGMYAAEMGVSMLGSAAVEHFANASGGNKTKEGRQISTIGGSAVSGASMGMMMGSAFGPLGMAAGAVIGGIGGALYGQSQMPEIERQAASQKRMETIDKARGKMSSDLAIAANAQAPEKTRKEAEARAQASFNTIASASREEAVSGAKKKERTWAEWSAGVGPSAAKTVDERVESARPAADAAKEMLMAKMQKTGKTLEELEASMPKAEFAQLSEAIALTDKGYASLLEASIEQKERIMASNMSEADKKKALDASAATLETARQAAMEREGADLKAAGEAAKMAKENAKVSQAAQKVVTSFERMATALDAASARADKVMENGRLGIEAIDNPMVALQQGQISKSTDVLSNPNAYSIQEVEQAARQNSGMAGSSSEAMVQSAVLPRKLEQSFGIAMQAARTGGKDETETRISVKDAMNKTVEEAFGPDISAGMREKISEFVDNAKGDITELDFNDLLKAVPELADKMAASGKVMEALKNQAQTAANAIAMMSDAAQKGASKDQEVRNNNADTFSTIANSTLAFRRGTGEKISWQADAGVRTQARAMRLGTTPDVAASPRAMLNRYNQLKTATEQASQNQQQVNEANRPALLSGDEGSVKGATGAMAAAANATAQFAQSTKQARDEIMALPNDIKDNISGIMQELQDVMQERAAKLGAAGGFMEKVLTSTPQDLKKMGNTFNNLNRTLSGKGVSFQESYSANKAYQQVRNQGGNHMQAQRAAQEAYAQESGDTISMAKELAPLLGAVDPDAQSKMMGSVYESMFAARGIDTSQMKIGDKSMKDYIDMMKKGAKEDPKVKALQDALAGQQAALKEAAATANTVLMNEKEEIIAKTGVVIEDAMIKGAEAVKKAMEEAKIAGITAPGEVGKNKPGDPGKAPITAEEAKETVDKNKREIEEAKKIRDSATSSEEDKKKAEKTIAEKTQENQVLSGETSAENIEMLPGETPENFVKRRRSLIDTVNGVPPSNTSATPTQNAAANQAATPTPTTGTGSTTPTGTTPTTSTNAQTTGAANQASAPTPPTGQPAKYISDTQRDDEIAQEKAYEQQAQKEGDKEGAQYAQHKQAVLGGKTKEQIAEEVYGKKYENMSDEEKQGLDAHHQTIVGNYTNKYGSLQKPKNIGNNATTVNAPIPVQQKGSVAASTPAAPVGSTTKVSGQPTVYGSTNQDIFGNTQITNPGQAAAQSYANLQTEQQLSGAVGEIATKMVNVNNAPSTQQAAQQPSRPGPMGLQNVHKEAYLRGMSAEEVRSERQQQYLSRLNPETRARMEKKLGVTYQPQGVQAERAAGMAGQPASSIPTGVTGPANTAPQSGSGQNLPPQVPQPQTQGTGSYTPPSSAGSPVPAPRQVQSSGQQNQGAGVLNTNGFEAFATKLDTLLTKLAEVNIPTEIRLTSENLGVNVTLNGGEVMAKLPDSLKQSILQETAQQIANYDRGTTGEGAAQNSNIMGKV